MEIEESVSFEQSTTSNHTNTCPHRLNLQLWLTLPGSKRITTSHLVSKCWQGLRTAREQAKGLLSFSKNRPSGQPAESLVPCHPQKSPGPGGSSRVHTAKKQTVWLKSWCWVRAQRSSSIEPRMCQEVSGRCEQLMLSAGRTVLLLQFYDRLSKPSRHKIYLPSGKNRAVRRPTLTSDLLLTSCVALGKPPHSLDSAASCKTGLDMLSVMSPGWKIQTFIKYSKRN